MSATQTVNTTERLARLRELMRSEENKVNAYVVPSEDQHSSEYIAECDERRAFISGFNGSAGLAIVTENEALLFTDGRYFLQAEKQLDHTYEELEINEAGNARCSNLARVAGEGTDSLVYAIKLHVAKHTPDSTRIGIDPTLIAASDASSLSKSLEKKGSGLVPLNQNLVDVVWKNRPARPANKIFHLDEKYSGESHISKLERVREEIAKKQTKALVLTALDEIAWLFNLRGSDIAYNPVFFSYAVITQDTAALFVQSQSFQDGNLQDTFGDSVQLLAYDDIWQHLNELGSKVGSGSQERILATDRSSLAIVNAIGQGKYETVPSPVSPLKAIKNSAELKGFRESHIRDGVALVRYFSWLEEQLNDGRELTEWQGAEQLEKFRSELDLFQGLSFDTISSTGPNGAIIHYSPSPTDSAVIKKEQVYLCDSGAQFLDGTTDVTRTWHFGQPTAEQKRAFTRVLQGHIALDTLVFPNGTTAMPWLEDLSGKMDWIIGHGVGHFLNVHEGPHGIGIRIAYNTHALKAGMTVSNEPGYYEDGHYGIRIESIILVKEFKTPNNFANKGYLGFEHVTMCPIQTKFVDTSLLTAEETKWLNQYHQEVWEKLSSLLQHDQRALVWLKRECAPI